jgi:uncharacterized protein (DUF1697 family)
VPSWIALLRGINVGGSKKLPMAQLRDALERTPCTSVTTYIQSGNIVFDHPKTARGKLQAMLETAIERAAGFAVPIVPIERAAGYAVPIVKRSSAELGAIIENNPYPRVEPTRLHVAFLPEAPDKKAVRGIDREAFAPETFVAAGPNVYLHLPNGMGKSKLGQRLGMFGTDATVRNWNTVLKLHELSER